MMNRTERQELKRKARKELNIAYWLLGTFIAFLLILFLTPLSDILLVTEGVSDFMVTLRIGLTVMVIAGMGLAALSFSTKSSWTLQDIQVEKHRMKAIQNKFHAKLLWEAIQKKDFEEAQRLYNLDHFITGSMRVLCNGIMMGIATQVPIDNDWGEGVYERMESYLK